MPLAIASATVRVRTSLPCTKILPEMLRPYTRPRCEARSLDDRALLRGVPDRPVLDAQHLLAGARLPLGVEALQVAADHPADDPLLRRVRIEHVHGLDGAAVADDGGAVGDADDLVQLVRDHDRGDAALLERAQQ